MSEMLTETELVQRIKQERQSRGIAKAEVARWIGVKRQMMTQLEDPEYKGRKALQDRIRILSMLLDGVEVAGPYVMVNNEPGLFDQKEAVEEG